jgi:hypothetical protein
MNNCKHPKAYVSNIGYYCLCNICGEKFLQEEPTFKGTTKIDIPQETIDNIGKNAKPKRKYTRRVKLDI